MTASLARAFWAARRAARGDPAEPPAPDGLEEAVAAAIGRARARLPDIAFDAHAFAADLGSRLRASDDPVAAVGACHAGDLWLARAAADGVPEAVRRLEDEVLSDTRRIVAGLGAAGDVVDDVLQELRARLLLPRGDRPPEILEYAGRGPLGGWLRVVAVRQARRVLAARRQQGAAARPDALLDRLVVQASRTLSGEARDRHRSAVEEALLAALARLEPRERNLLRHQLVDELPVREVARLYNVHFATASRWTAAARDRLLLLLREELASRVPDAPLEADSLVRAVRADVDVSLERLLR